MASTGGGRVKAESKASSGGNSIEVFPWLKTLPLAPEYHPTLAEFQDPIAYIFKIEKEASKYGICKIVPPVSAPSKKTAIANLNRSLLARSNNSNPKSTPTFTTRQQQVGFCPRKHRPVKKPVWQSGESYTVPEFEAKAKLFEKNYLKKGIKRPLTALEVETLYWKATLDKPFSVEYANDMPGSAFVPLSGKKSKGTGEGVTVGETAWNMRGVSRSNGSLLKFMKEDIPGVTSPMVYLAMMFSWFAWHVEDHDLHSLNYMHMGAGKTWYGVPRDAAVAFEDVIRVHGYGGEINPIVTFSTLGEKTTVMSPEVLLDAGVPCCRLVQNAGEFVVTFPRAYHSGFSHGFNCGEASNIATPEWLKLARDAAIRRASTNCPPMVSHVQLLYDLALSLSSRVPATTIPEPRSSRLKDKKKGEGETLVKELFVQDVVQNRELLYSLGKGSPVVLLPRDSIENSIQTKLRVGYPVKAKSDLSSGSSITDGKMKVYSDLALDKKQGPRGSNSMKGKFAKPNDGNRLPLFGGSNDESCGPLSCNQNTDTEGERSAQCDRLPNKGLFSCVTCGILCFACVAIVKPTEVASHNLMSSNCSNFSDWNDGSKVHNECLTRLSGNANSAGLNSGLGWTQKSTRSALIEVPRESVEPVQTTPTDGSRGLNFHAEVQKGNSSLGLLALTYGDSSDSEEDQIEAPVNAKKPESSNFSAVDRLDSDDSGSPSNNHQVGASGRCIISFPLRSCEDKVPLQTNHSCEDHMLETSKFEDRDYQTSDHSFEFQINNTLMEANSLEGRSCHFAHDAKRLSGSALASIENRIMSFAPIADEDSSRLHVFCLQHAAEVEQQLHSVGGVHLLLLCHPDYPKLQAEAKLMADELGSDHPWSDIEFREATDEDKETINSALESEECIHGNGDWAVKMGINLYYSANLSRSPLYSKQIPYNTVMYGAFGCSASSDDPAKAKVYEKGSGKHKKIVVAGKWCGKVWMSNQVHPLLAGRDDDDEREQERRFRPLSAPEHPRSSLKLKKPSKTHKTDLASSSSKVGRKRKNSDDDDEREQERGLLALPVPEHPKSGLKLKKPTKSHLADLASPSNKIGRKRKNADDDDDNDDDDDDVEREQERGFLALPAPEHPKSGLKLKKPTKSHSADLASASSKTGIKRKNTDSRSAARAKSLKVEEPIRDLDDAPDNKFIRQYKRNFRNKRKKETKETPQPRDNCEQETKRSTSDIEDQPDGGPSTRLRKRTSRPLAGHSAKFVEEKIVSKKRKGNTTAKKASAFLSNKNSSDEEAEYACNMEEKIISKKRTGNRKSKKTSACHNKKNSSDEEAEYACNMEEKYISKKRTGNAKAKKASASHSNKNSSEEEAEYACDMEGCTMSFNSERELMLHKENICPVKGCGKSFFSHKYLVQHRRVHVDDRPLKCPWKGCEMTFKWAWARTEHIRVHTGARPYICNVTGCGQTFRFVSDFSRHKRKTGHSTKKVKRQI